jgi:hypothetical protein
VTYKIERRDFINKSLTAAGAALGTRAINALATTPSIPSQTKTIPLEQLDLGKLQIEPPPAAPEKLRTDNGVRLPPGSRLWVDLKGVAINFTATLGLEAGSGAISILCRFSTGAEFREMIVWARGWSPKTLTLPLAGKDTLIIETEALESMDGITVLLSNAVITYTGEPPEAFVADPIVWKTGDWRVTTDGKSGGMTQLTNPRDPHAMNWIRPTGRWGVGLLRLGESRDAWLRPFRLKQTGSQSLELTYKTNALDVFLRRRIDGKRFLRESYLFTNRQGQPLKVDADSIGILIPINDRYPRADICLTRCCNAHIWPGGNFAYVCALRMGGAAPHLGLVVTEGAISDYSIDNRPETSNDRGWVVLHPKQMTLAPGESLSVSWVLFWHDGWDDFFAKAIAVPGFVRMEAEEYTVVAGQSVRIAASSATPLERVRLLANGREIPTRRQGRFLKADFRPETHGEQRIECDADGKRGLLRAFVTPPPMDLIRSRVGFIIEHQQKRAPRAPLDGAYLIYDNETNQQVYGPYDHDAGRERVGMGVLAALYAPHCRDNEFRTRLMSSLKLYKAFVLRELQDESGTVYDDVGRQKTQRLYNYPWVAHLHLAMHGATGEIESLWRYVNTCRRFYELGGEKFYPIGMPIRGGLKSLETAGLSDEHEELLGRFRRHADVILKTGTAYPKLEVNYEQSIVGPAVQILLETYLATRERAYLEGARSHLECLEAFNGRQPDYHLNEIAIRHWDDYWFGKRRIYGDTQPHYWSTITAVAFNLFSEASGDKSYARRARRILLNNLCCFSSDGRAYSAYVNPLTVNGQPGKFFDPWANDQDWALVNWLTLQ